MKKGIKSTAENGETNLNLGHAFFQIGEYEESLKYLLQIENNDSRKNLRDLYMGYNYLELGLLQQAKSHFKASAKNNPRLMGNVLREIALIDLLGKLKEDKGDRGLENALAQFYNAKNDYKKSLEYSIKVLSKDPMNKQALRNIIFSYRGLGKPREVFAYGMQYEMVNPNDRHFHYIMAEMYMRTLNYDKATFYLEKILKQDDTYRDVQKLLKQCKEAIISRSS